jgi:signal transduction histidine kinase
MLLISRRRPQGTAQNGRGHLASGFDIGSPLPELAPTPRGRRRLDAREAVVVFAAAVVAATIPAMLLGAGGPVGMAVSFGAQIILVSLAGVAWWLWRRRQDRILADLVVGASVAWTVGAVAMGLALAVPAHADAYGAVVRVASPVSNALALLVMAWLCRGRGWRLGLVRLGQGAGLLILLGASCWVLLLGSGQVITDLPVASRVIALGYLSCYLASLCLGWYALFRRRRVGIPGLGLLYLAQAVGGGTTALVAVRSLAGRHTFGTPVELGWVVAGALVLAAAAARRVPSQPWERNRQRMALVGVLLLAAGSMALGVARFVDEATVGLQVQHEQGERLREAVDRVYMLIAFTQQPGARIADGEAGRRDYRTMIQTQASVAHSNLLIVSDLAERQRADRAEREQLARLVGDLDAYTAMLQASPIGAPSTATVERGDLLLGRLWAAAKDSDRHHEDGLGEMRRVTALLQFAVPLGLLVAGLTFVSSWTTLAKRERLLEAAAARRELTKAVVHAQERERGRIAADLHDGPLQQVAAWRIKVEMVLRKLDRDPPQARELLASLDQEVAQQAVELRRLMHALRPPVLDELGLEAAVGVLARDTSVRAGVEITLDAGLNGLRCTPEVETLAYRIVQEGLTNVAKHAAATEAVVSLRESDGGLLVRIADNGRGMREFEPDQLVREGHFGLAGIDERVEIAGGRLELVTAGGEGTTLEARLPASLEAPGEQHEE